MQGRQQPCVGLVDGSRARGDDDKRKARGRRHAYHGACTGGVDEQLAMLRPRQEEDGGRERGCCWLDTMLGSEKP